MDRVFMENSKWETFRIHNWSKNAAVITQCFLSKKLQNSESTGWQSMPNSLKQKKENYNFRLAIKFLISKGREKSPKLSFTEVLRICYALSSPALPHGCSLGDLQIKSNYNITCLNILNEKAQRDWRMAVKSFCLCAGLEWKRVKIFHSSCYSAMFWICAAHVDNTGQFSLLLSCTDTGSRCFLLHIPPSWFGQEVEAAGTSATPFSSSTPDQVDITWGLGE